MTKHIEWRRAQIAIRWRRRVAVALLLLCGPPALVALVSLVWRLCAYVVAA